jgi:hypothetical protein
MQSIYTGIIGGGALAAAAVIATGSLRGLRFGVFGYAVSAIASWYTLLLRRLGTVDAHA